MKRVCFGAIIGFLGILLPQVLRADILLNENFASGTPPAGWSTTAIAGTQVWTFRNTPVFGGGSRYAVFDDEELGAGTTPNHAVLVSPSFNPTGRTAVFLRYTHHWFGVENTLGAVELSTDGGTTWSTIVNYSNVTQGSLAAPATVTHNISAAVSGHSNVRVRFRYSDGGQAGRFWYLDDVVVYTEPDVGVGQLIAPAPLACGSTYSAAETVTARVFNYGYTDYTAVNLPVVLSGTFPQSTTYSGTIPAGGFVDVTFPATVNMTASGFTYVFQAFTDLAADGFRANDTTLAYRANLINSFPYLQDFNTSTGGWTAYKQIAGQPRDWVWGALPPSYAGGPAGAGNSWRLVNNGGTGSWHEVYVESPVFDFTGLTNPVLAFDFKLNLQGVAGYNGVRVEYSTNGGTTWNLLGDNADYGFYQLAPWGYTSGFGGPNALRTVTNWTHARRSMCPLANNPCVKLRFSTLYLGTAPAYTGSNAEFAFDNVSIIDQSPDVGAVLLVAPTLSPGSGCGFSTSQSVTVRVYNYSCATVTNVPVTTDITGTIVQTLTGNVASIPALSFVDFTYATTVDMSAVGTYNFNSYTTLPGDVYAANNSNLTVRNTAVTAINTFPYSENFSGGEAGWTGQVVNATWRWQWGEPPATYANNGGSEGQGGAWYLNATAGSGNLELLSPIFDFTNLNNPELSFDIKMDLNSAGDWNGVRMQYSLDGGLTWIALGSNAEPNWYSPYQYCYNGASWGGCNASRTLSNYTRVSRKLCTLSGQPCVRFRFFTDWLGGSGPREFAMDNFFIGNPDPLDVEISAIQRPRQPGCAGFSASEQIEVAVFNNSCLTLTNVPVSVSLSGAGTGGPFVQNIASIPPQSCAVTLFTAPNVFNMTAAGSYTITATTTFVDSDASNNTLVETRQTGAISTFPYVQQFNADNGNFVAYADAGCQRRWRHGALPVDYAGGPQGEGQSWRIVNNGGVSNQNIYLESPVFDLTSLSNPMLAFDFKMNLLSAGGYNGVQVEYSTNGGTSWNLLGDNGVPDWYSNAPWDWTSGFGGVGGTPRAVHNWTRARKTLCEVSGQSCVKFRLRTSWLHNAATHINANSQFAVDNFSIFANNPDVGVVEIVSPVENPSAICPFPVNQSVQVRVHNFSCTPISNVPVSVDIAGPVNTTLSGVVPGPIPAASSVVYTLPTTFDMSAIGLYSFDGYTTLAGDVYAPNDDTQRNVNVLVGSISAFPYSENFNGGAAGWAGQSTSPTWEWRLGTLPATYANNGGPEGNTNSWHLVATAGGGNIGLVSPIFDFTNLNDPELSFDIKMDLNSAGDWNGVRMQYSLDGGLTWIALGSNAEPNWYSPYQYCYNGASWGGCNARRTLSNWTRVSRRLCDLSGSPCVRFRFFTDWLGGSGPREFAMDNFFIGNPSPIDIALTNVSRTRQRSCTGFGAAEVFSVAVTNNACIALNNVPVTLQVTGPTGIAPVTEFVNVPARGCVMHTFAPTLNMTGTGTWSVNMSSTFVDANAANNTLVQDRRTAVINTYPYTQNWETGNAGWVSSADNLDCGRRWEWGPLPADYVNGPQGNGNSWRLVNLGGASWSNDVYLESPVFDLTGIANPELSFDFKQNLYGPGGYNGVRVLYSLNGGAWTVLGANTDPQWYSVAPWNGGTGWGWNGTGGATAVNGWTNVRRNVCPVAGGTCVKFRIQTLYLGTTTNLLNNNAYFAVDNFQLRDAGPDVAMQTFLLPTTGSNCGLDASVPVQVRLQNLSCNALTNVPVTLTVAGPIPHSQSVTVPNIAANSTLDFTFPTPIDMSSLGTYNLMAVVNIPDLFPQNDTARRTIVKTIPVITAFPYSENFSGGTAGWNGQSSSATWEWRLGTLPAAYANNGGPQGQTNSWHLVATAGGGNLQLVSPVFDFTTVQNPVVTFDMKLHLNSSGDWNGVRLQYSLNDGVSWTTLGDNAEPNWYSPYQYCYNGASWGGCNSTRTLSPWTVRSRSLCELKGQACVRFRFFTDWLGGSGPREFAMDNFRIEDTPMDAEVIGITGCYGASEPLQVTIRHRQRCPGVPNLTSANLTVAINGTPTTVALTGLNVAPGGTHVYTTAPMTVPAQTSVVRAWVKNPNGLVDGVVFNDTLTANLATFPHCNDHCRHAIDLTIGTTTASQTTAATPNATEDPTFGTCGGGVTVENTVWYRFQTNAAGGEVTVLIHNIASVPAANGVQVEIAKADAMPYCNPANRTPLHCSNTGSLADIQYGPTVLDANAFYYIIVDGYAGNNANFNITLQGDGLLPVEGLLLHGQWQRNEQDALLSWRTTRETNNAYFELQRSLDNRIFEVVTQVPGAGTTDTPRQYSHLDANLPADRYYYRLKQVDLDGTGHLSNTVLLSRLGTSRGVIGLYPNPVRSGEDLLLQLDQPEDERLDIDIYDVLGKQLYSHTHRVEAGTRTLAIPTDGLAQGSYVLRVNGRWPGSHRFQVLAR